MAVKFKVQKATKGQIDRQWSLSSDNSDSQLANNLSEEVQNLKQAVKENRDIDMSFIESKPLSKQRLFDQQTQKSMLLQEEGNALADEQLFEQAIQKWDMAIQLTPQRAILYEQKSQAYQEIDQLFIAVKCAHKATQIDPQWPVGFLTLARAQLNLGEPLMAYESYATVLRLQENHKEAKVEIKQAEYLCNQYIIKDSEGKRAITLEKDELDKQMEEQWQNNQYRQQLDDDSLDGMEEF